MKIFEAEKLISENKISPVELAKSVLDAIETKNKEINAFITVDDVMGNAQKLGDNTLNSPLWGIPVAIKDNICTKDLLTTAGSKMLSEFVPPYDATAVERLKSCGSVIVGKTNLDQFGMGSECTNSYFGKTRNPINRMFVSGGSSGGSAAAVKAGMALGALGTDTGGSIRLPAAFCGLYGLKPTYSLVSRYGLIAFASSLDCIGTLCLSAKDTAIMLDSIQGFDKKDATSKNVKGEYYNRLTSDIKGLKIGVPKEFFENTETSVKEAVIKALKNYESLGAKVEECSLKSLKYALGAYYVISSAEASSNLARFDGVRFTKRCEEYSSLEEMYIKTRSENFGDEVKRRIMLGTFVLSEAYYDRYYLKAKKAQSIIKGEFDNLFEKYDALLTPVSSVPVWRKGEIEEKSVYMNDICTASVSLAGLPAMSIPCGKDCNSMPVGMQLIGKSFDEQTLLNMAWAYEEGGFYDGI